MTKRKRRSFSDEYKAEVVALVRDGGKSIGVISKELDLTESSVRGWVRQAEVDAGEGPEGALTTAEREELRQLRRENRELRMEREILKKGDDGLLRQGEPVRFRFIEGEKARYPVRLLCRCLAVSRSGFYAWRKRRPSARAREDARLKVESKAAHRASRETYGSIRIQRDLHEGGHDVSRKRVARLMRELGIEGRHKRRYRTTTDSQHRFPVAPNVLMREFDVDAPNTAWVTDITYLATTEGWLYLSVILDLFLRRVVGYAMSTRIDRALVLDAFSKALHLRPDVRDLVFHSDRGSQFASHEYREALDQAGTTCSMSRRGNCWDNAVAESFFGTLEIELFYDRPLRSREATRAAVANYIDEFYNVRRRHSSLGCVSPVEYELKQRNGELGGFTPDPPFLFEGREPEMPTLTI